MGSDVDQSLQILTTVERDLQIIEARTDLSKTLKLHRCDSPLISTVIIFH